MIVNYTDLRESADMGPFLWAEPVVTALPQTPRSPLLPLPWSPHTHFTFVTMSPSGKGSVKFSYLA